MRIGIYGGSFDTVHNGHINAAKTFMKELSLDKIIIVPAYCSPFKKGLAVTPSQHRLNMCNIAFGALPACGDKGKGSQSCGRYAGISEKI